MRNKYDGPIDVSIVIVTWNVADLLKNCLASIERHGSHGLSLQIIVVDNNSTDGTVELVRRDFGWVTLIANEKNLGFAKANNQAINICTGNFVLLLNPDTEVYEGSIEKMADFLNCHPDYGAVGPKLVSPEHKVWYEGARNLPRLVDVVGEAFMVRRLFPRSKVFGGLLLSYWDHESDRDVDCLQGACILVRKTVIEKIGVLDETLFMYFEDVDYCARIRQAGLKIKYLAGAVVLHVWQGSTNRSLDKQNRVIKLTYQAYHFFLKKHKSRIHAELARAIVIGAGIFRIVFFTIVWFCSRDTKMLIPRDKGIVMLNSMRTREMETAGNSQ